jgi:hypothetical protein
VRSLALSPPPSERTDEILTTRRGKTTILYRLQIGEVVTTIPTIGFNVETVQYKNIKFQVRSQSLLLLSLASAHSLAKQVWDLGGQTSIRPYWRCYYADTKAVVYVVDSSDRERLPINKAELLAMLNEEELQDAKLLVFANKQVRFLFSSFLSVSTALTFLVTSGSTRCDDRGRSLGRIGTRHAQEPAMEHSQVVRNQGRGS